MPSSTQTSPRQSSAEGALTPRAHLEACKARVRVLIQRHMRRYAERLFDAKGELSDMCIGPLELGRLIGAPQALEAQRRLDELGVPSLNELEETLERQRRELASRLTTLDEGVVLPIEELRAGFGLTDRELDLLMLAAAPRLTVDLSRLLALAWADFSQRQPTAGFLAEVIADHPDEIADVLALMGPRARLMGYRLLIAQEHPSWRPHTPRVHAPISVSQRLLDYLTADLLTEAGLKGCELTGDGLSGEQLVLESSVQVHLLKALRKPQARVCLMGTVGAGRRTIVRSFTARAGQKLLTVSLVDALDNDRPLLVQLAEILREARLHHGALLLRLDGLTDHPALDTLKSRSAAVRALFRDFPGPLFLAATERTLVSIFVQGLEPLALTPPPREGQRDLWLSALRGVIGAEEAEVMAEELSASYRLFPGAIHRSIHTALDDRRERRGTVSMTSLLKSVRKQFDHSLGWLADAVVVNMSLDDVVLSSNLRKQVHEILTYARHSEQVFEQWRFQERSPTGQGMPVMFSGPPGTGKTLLAGVLARELGRALYKVDLSRIVDKYIGETEKNLGKVFDEAERAQAMLLFDEADSLFAKRTDVKSSNDRYANLEVNYLLQRLENFEGISVLTTNFPSSIDEAFQRRIRFKLSFPMPDAAMRLRLWRKLMPPDAPVDPDIDWDTLAETFEFSGGHIKNAVLRASIQAASQSSPIDQLMLVNASVAESREMGMLIRDEV